jgi:hypothetical protein
MARTFASAAAGMFAAAGIISALKASVKLAGEQEQAEKQLEKQLGKNIDGLKRYAASQQLVTTFGDEVTLRAAAQFAQFTKNEDQIKQLISVTQDYAAAQGVDLVSAAALVAKSFGSSTNAMSRYGVEVEGAAGSSERLNSLLGNMSEKFGGQATAAAETFAGQMQQTENAIGDAGEALGVLLIPAVQKIAEDIQLAAEWWSEFLSRVGGTGSVSEPIEVLRDNLELAMLQAPQLRDALAELAEETDPERLTAWAKGWRAAGLYDAANAAGALAVALEKVSEEEEKQTEIKKEKVPLQIQEEEFALRGVPVAEANLERLDRMAVAEDKLAIARKASVDFASQMPGKLAAVNAAFKGSSEVTRRAAQVQAVIDTYASANAAYKAMVGIPIVGPTLAAVAAATAIAQGLGNVAMIERQKFAQGGSFETSGPMTISTGTGRYLVGDNPGGRERVDITPTSSRGKNAPGGKVVNLYFMGPITNEDFVRDFIVPEVERAGRSA